MLTTSDGPVVASEKTLRALIAIRRQNLLGKLYNQRVVIARSIADAIFDVLNGTDKLNYLDVQEDREDVELPSRVAGANRSDAATLRLALGVGASVVLLEDPIKERAKLSFIKSEGTISILVQAHRLGFLSAVQPMVKALEKLGFADVLPPPDQLQAIWRALEDLE